MSDQKAYLRTEKDIPAILTAMSAEEKLSLIGEESAVYTKAFPQYGIPSLCLTDGATGINFGQFLIDESEKAGTDGVPSPSSGKLFGRLQEVRKLESQFKEGTKEKKMARVVLSHYPQNEDPTSYPCGAMIGATWSPDEAQRAGEAVGSELYEGGVDVMMGPNVDLQRDPRGGRAYECPAEDPVLCGKIAAAQVRGIQKSGVAACIKHFVMNNQETDRNELDTDASEQTKRELYYKVFETSVKEGHPFAIMSAYNKVAGVHCAENRELLTDLLRKEWGFEGAVISDWGAVHDETKAIQAGGDLVTPGPQPLEQARRDYKAGILKDEEIDASAGRILRLILDIRNARGQKQTKMTVAQRRKVAYDTAVAGSVLLKNDGVLPLKKEAQISVFGRRSKEMIAYGGGSTEVPSAYETNLYDCLKEKLGERCRFEEEDSGDTVIYTAGENGHEGADLGSMQIEEEDRLRMTEVLRRAKKSGKKTVVILNVACPVDMRDWTDLADAVLLVFLPGCEGGRAAADILTGDADPAGRLPVTFPVRYEDTPTWINFPGSQKRVFYGEGIYLGYRYYDAKGIRPKYPFGYGLSYTSFRITADSSPKMLDLNEAGSRAQVQVTVKNIGSRRGAEVVQLYVGQENSYLLKPVKELKDFRKVYLNPGEEQTITLQVTGEDLQAWDMERHTWTVETGRYHLYIARSAQDLLADIPLKVTGLNPYGITPQTRLDQVMTNPEAFETLTGKAPFIIRLLQENPMIRTRCLGEILDAQLIRQNPNAVEAKKMEAEILENLKDYTAG